MSVKPMWKEGLFLMPQHLQQMDAYYERVLDRRMLGIGAHLWGAIDLVFDTEELARGIVRLSRCTAVMPDGLVVEIGPGHELESLVLTAPGGVSSGKPVGLYLGVPAASRTASVRPGQPELGSRFAHVVRTVTDAYESAGDVEVECIHPNVQLLSDHSNRQNYVTIKIAELTVSDAGRMTFNENYVPPCLRISVSDALNARLSRLVAALAAKQSDLVAKYGGRGVAMVEFGAADMTTFWYLHTVNTMLPSLLHLASSSAAHPEQLYLALATLAGQLSSFETGTDPAQIPRFDFQDLTSSIIPLFDRCFQLLGTVVSARYQQIQLEQTQPGLFVGRVDDPQLLQNKLLYLLAGGDVPDDTLRDDVPRYVKVGSMDQIADIVQSALPGVGIQIDTTPPTAIPVRAHMVYMRLDKQGRYWDAVTQSGTVAIYQPVKPEKVKLELLAVER